jgi:hypothetical protein
MPSLARLLPLLALCAVTSLTACKDSGGGSNPPATPAAGAPTDKPVEPPPAGDAVPVEDGVSPIDPGTGANVACTPDTRKGGICTREYRPVCGAMGDSTSRTFSNKCVACSDEKVTSYVPGPCPGEPPG